MKKEDGPSCLWSCAGLCSLVSRLPVWAPLWSFLLFLSAFEFSPQCFSRHRQWWRCGRQKSNGLSERRARRWNRVRAPRGRERQERENTCTHQTCGDKKRTLNRREREREGKRGLCCFKRCERKKHGRSSAGDPAPCGRFTEIRYFFGCGRDERKQRQRTASEKKKSAILRQQREKGHRVSLMRQRRRDTVLSP